MFTLFSTDKASPENHQQFLDEFREGMKPLSKLITEGLQKDNVDAWKKFFLQFYPEEVVDTLIDIQSCYDVMSGRLRMTPFEMLILPVTDAQSLEEIANKQSINTKVHYELNSSVSYGIVCFVTTDLHRGSSLFMPMCVYDTKDVVHLTLQSGVRDQAVDVQVVSTNNARMTLGNPALSLASALQGRDDHIYPSVQLLLMECLKYTSIQVPFSKNSDIAVDRIQQSILSAIREQMGVNITEIRSQAFSDDTESQGPAESRKETADDDADDDDLMQPWS